MDFPPTMHACTHAYSPARAQHIVSGDYAARITDLRTYDSVSRDIVHRWTFPMVPDNNLLGALTSFTYARRNVYRERDVDLARSAVLGEDTVIGARTKIGDKSHVKQVPTQPRQAGRRACACRQPAAGVGRSE